MASMLLHFETDDYDAWKQRFDLDPVGRKQVATGHIISRGVDNPNSVFLRTDYRSVEEARSFRQHLLDSGVLDLVDLKLSPTVVELAENVTY